MVINNIVFDNGRPIDDLNVPSDRLGIRRLKSYHRLKKLLRVTFDLPHLIKRLEGQENWFIDLEGNIFKYVKTTTQRVVTHKILSSKYNNTCSLLKLEGIDYPFIWPRPCGYKYARVLYYNNIPWLILFVTDTFVKPGTKKV